MGQPLPATILPGFLQFPSLLGVLSLRVVPCLAEEPTTQKEDDRVPMFVDHHRGVEALTAYAWPALTEGEEIQDQYGVKYHRYWFNVDTGEAVHREAHGLVADEISEVQEGQP
jgi:hypothetical protein